MPVKCPSCNLMFGTRNELDWHVREEHTRSRLPARTPPADDTTPADLTAPVTVGAAHAGPQAPPPSPDQPQPDTTAIARAGPLAWLRRRLRPSGISRQPASVNKAAGQPAALSSRGDAPATTGCRPSLSADLPAA